MSRPLRIEFPGAIYHVTSRGDRREPIFEDDADRQNLLEVLAQAMDRFDAEVLAYCLMGNHYHFVLHTRAANLLRLMRHLNGVYTQNFNRQHQKVGHLFQGRFKAVLVDRDAYLLEVCRYVELNPVRARMVDDPAAWPWSSYRAHVGLAPTPAWLDTAGLHGYLLGRAPVSAADARRAAARYATLVAEGRDVRLWDSALRKRSTWATTPSSKECRRWPLRLAPRWPKCPAPSGNGRCGWQICWLLAFHEPPRFGERMWRGV